MIYKGFWGTDELDRLWSALDARPGPFWSTYFRLTYYFALRPTETAILQLDDVDLGRRRLRLTRLKKAAQHGGATALVYALTPAVAEMVGSFVDWRSAQRYHADNPFLFASRSGRSPARTPSTRVAQLRKKGRHAAVDNSTAHRAFKEACSDAGLPEASMMILRRSRAESLRRAGVRSPLLRLILSHSDGPAFWRATQEPEETLEEIAEALETSRRRDS